MNMLTKNYFVHFHYNDINSTIYVSRFQRQENLYFYHWFDYNYIESRHDYKEKKSLKINVLFNVLIIIICRSLYIFYCFLFYLLSVFDSFRKISKVCAYEYCAIKIAICQSITVCDNVIIKLAVLVLEMCT